MKVLCATGKESKFDFGWIVNKEHPEHKGFSLILVDVIWSTKTKNWGIGFGIPFVAAIGFFFQKKVTSKLLKDASELNKQGYRSEKCIKVDCGDVIDRLNL